MSSRSGDDNGDIQTCCLVGWVRAKRRPTFIGIKGAFGSVPLRGPTQRNPGRTAERRTGDSRAGDNNSNSQVLFR